MSLLSWGSRSNTSESALTKRAGTFMNGGTYHSAHDRYNGLVKSVRWNTAGAMAAGIDPATNPAQRRSNAFSYTYDHHYRLASATYGTYVAYRTNGPVGATYPGYGSQNAGFTPSATQAHLLGELTYDPNGNIKTMHRNGPTGNSMDRFIYRYAPGSNKLLSVKDQAGTTPWTAQDLEDQDPTSAYNPLVSSTWNYQYDAIGNSVENKGDDQVITYNGAGLVTEVRNAANILLISYAYSGDGKRVRMTEYDATGVPSLHTWYAGGAVYEQVPGSVEARQVEVSIGGGSGRLGIMYRQVVNTSHYALKDHLGNVRATFKRDGTLEEWTDYEPWGLPMEGRREVSSLHYRYGYQGKEGHDIGGVTTGAFSLRLWDARLGRWTAPDPYRQFASAYVGMGNQPHMTIDPNGGFAVATAGIIGAAVGAGVAVGLESKRGIKDAPSLIVAGIIGAGAGFMAGQGLHALGLDITANKIVKAVENMSMSGLPTSDVVASGIASIATTVNSAHPDWTDKFSRTLELTSQIAQDINTRALNVKVRFAYAAFSGSEALKIRVFYKLVRTGGILDIKKDAPGGGGPFVTTGYNFDNTRSGFALYNGHTMRADDFGNYNYGFFARMLGLDLSFVQIAAGANQHFTDFRKGNFKDAFAPRLDEGLDTERIENGFYHQYRTPKG